MEGIMNIEALAPGLSGFSRTAATTTGAEKIKENRDAADKKQSVADATAQNEKANSVQPEELLQSIKALTDNGAYSVRFELNKDTNEMVINLVEQESGEVIRQIPPEEVLGIHKMLSDLRGNLLQTTS
jgi:flagellar protein FlaG